jgi:hypothetical protein
LAAWRLNFGRNAPTLKFTIDDHELVANRDLLEGSMAIELSPWIRIIKKVTASKFYSVKEANDSSISKTFNTKRGF